MIDPVEALQQLPAKSVDAIVKLLLTLHQRARAGENIEVPLATLHLASGRDVTGRILDIDRSARVPTLLVHVPGNDPRLPVQDALYLSLDAVIALTVHQAGRTAHWLSFGKIAAPPGVPPPTQLTLKRQAEALGKGVSDAIAVPITCEITWDSIVETGEPLRVLSDLMTETDLLLHELAREAVSKETIAKALRHLRFAHASKPSVSLAAETLTVTASLAQDPAVRLTGPDLRSAVEKVF